MSKRRKQIKVIDLFAGAGGFGLGFLLASKQYKLLYSLEYDKWAVDTLKENNIDLHSIIFDDIKKYNTPEKIKRVCRSQPDVIIGGPPCQGFSNAGPMDPNDPRNSLFKNFAKWVDVLRPTCFVMENVRGLLNRKNSSGEKVIDIIQKTFEKLDYSIDIWDLNAANYGVPQNRERIFIVGNKLGKRISPPPITHYISLAEKRANRKLKTPITVSKAISDLPSLKAGEGQEISIYTKKIKSEYQNWAKCNQKVLFNHVTMVHTKRVIERFKSIQNGNSIDEVPVELQVRKRNGNGKLSSQEYNMNYRHLKSNQISYTIPASFYSNFIHPSQPRNITSREAARLQSFPDWYKFMGKRTQISSKLLLKLGKKDEDYLSQYNQIGNAVPPLLSKAIASHILKFIKRQAKNKRGKQKG